MHHLRSRVASVLLIVVVAIAAAGCSGQSTTAATTRVDAPAAVAMLDSRTVIDVRTPAEYAAGHIAGAHNIDVEAADFLAKASSLDKGAPYLVYCQSGRRSAIAAGQLAGAGFTDIVDGGGMADLVAAGAPTE